MLSEFLNLEQWQKIQDLFAEIVGANLWLISSQGIPLVQPSKICTYCSDITSSSYTTSKVPDCAFQAYQISREQNDFFYQCPHRVTYFLVPLKRKENEPTFVIGGPIILGKREDDQDYQLICQKLGVDYENFKDWIRGLKLFSHNGINLVVNFLKELSYPLFSQTEKKVPAHDVLSHSLLDIASQIVGADSGSVLLIDPSRKSFSIQSSHGLNAEVLKKKRVPFKDGVAEWVVEHKKPVLISTQGQNEIPKSKLKRSSIRSSMVVPLQFQNQVYGVFCLNSKSENDRFNQQNLLFLNQLGQVASAALSS